jgi:hypothetical protein
MILLMITRRENIITMNDNYDNASVVDDDDQDVDFHDRLDEYDDGGEFGGQEPYTEDDEDLIEQPYETPSKTGILMQPIQKQKKIKVKIITIILLSI